MLSDQSVFVLDPIADVDLQGRQSHQWRMKSKQYLIALVSIFLLGCLEQPAEKSQDYAVESDTLRPAIELTGRVSDAANILDETQEDDLSAKLDKLEASTQHQMVVVTVPSLGGRDIKPFATDLGNAWGIGRKDFNDGIIILLAPNERQVRIAVGYGLEDTLTDKLCAEIIENFMLPEFRQGDYYSGVSAGVDALIDALH